MNLIDPAQIDYFALIKDVGFPIAIVWFLLTRAGVIARQLVEAHVGFITALGASQIRLEAEQSATKDILMAQTQSLGLIHNLLTTERKSA